jgi:hypothetical protein
MRVLLISALLMAQSVLSFSQVKIADAGGSPHPSSMLEVQSTTGGFLLPRMTTSERNAIASPASGLQIFNTSSGCFEFFLGGVWQTLGCGCTAAPGTPSAGTQVASPDQVVWNWNAVSGAEGYRYNTTNDYGTAVDAGTAVTYTQTGLNMGTSYSLYVWAYNLCGASAPLTLNATTGSVVVGDSFKGGIVAYILQSGDPGFVSGETHGFVVQATDIIVSPPTWGCNGTSISGTSVNLGTGQANTNAIIAGCATAGIPARLCDNLTIGSNSNWYLPSKEEVNKLYINRAQINGNFLSGGAAYASSSQQDATTAWAQRLDNGYQGNYQKSNEFGTARCISNF